MLLPHSQLWQNVRSRGPAEGPGTSGRSIVACSSFKHPSNWPKSSQAAVITAQLQQPNQGAGDDLSSNGSALALSVMNRGPVTLQQPGSSAIDENGKGKRLRKLLLSFAEKAEVASSQAAAGPSKILKLNIDLLLWRCRQARLQAQLLTDKEQRRTLLKQSEEGLRRCLALDPMDPRTYVVLGKTLMVQKRYDEARKLYSDGVANTGNTNPYIWSAWGWLEYKTGNYTQARQLFDAAIVVEPTHACAWHKWGMLEKSQGNYQKARDLWMQGIQKCRKVPQNQNAYLYNALAVMASQLGRVEEARAWFEEGTRTLEGIASVALWQAWAVLEATKGDATAVRYLFKKALLANPRSRYVHLAWALWERKQGNLDLCIQLLQRGQALNPTDAAIYQAWGVVEKNRGNLARARELFEQGLRADPSHVQLWQAYGYLEFQQNNYDRARELYQEGVWADPRSKDTVFIFHAWGVLERAARNHSLARELFKAAIKVDPKNEVVWDTWIDMESELGFLERADDLRQRRAEQQWEFEVPAGFTTRPESSPLSAMIDTLGQFFKSRAEATRRDIKDFFPEDFEEGLELQDVLPTWSSPKRSQADQSTFAEVNTPQLSAATSEESSNDTSSGHLEISGDEAQPQPPKIAATLVGQGRRNSSPGQNQKQQMSDAYLPQPARGRGLQKSNQASKL